MTLPTLDSTERKALEHLATWTRDAQQLRRAPALLWLDEGESVAELADRLRLSRQVISTWMTQCHARQGFDITARLAPGIRSGRPRPLQGRMEPRIAAVITRDPRDLGDHSPVWTAPLLTQDRREDQALPVSRPSVSRARARLARRGKRPRHRLARRPATWRQAKGGANGVGERVTTRCCGGWTRRSSPHPHPASPARGSVVRRARGR
jgi:transposase